MLKGYGPLIKIALLLIIIGAPAYALYSIYAPAADDEARPGDHKYICDITQ